MTPGRTRQARVRARRWGAGERQVTVWLDRTALTRLAALRQPGEHASDVVRRALQALAEAHNRAIEEQIRAIEERHSAMQAKIREMADTGLTNRQIANRLNKQGVPTGVVGVRWDEDRVLAYTITNAGVSDWSVVDSRLTPVP
jgi:Arc/MetJ-type ribon-helix-helix transcriptional regulator